MTVFVRSLWAFSLGPIFLLFSSCSDAPPPSRPQPTLSDLYPGWSAEETSDRALSKKDRTPILHGIVREEYENLDPFIERFNETYRNGESRRDFFYQSFSNYWKFNRKEEAFRWHPVYEKNMKTWSTMKPDSPVPTIGMASLYLSRAWLYRGGDWANDVTEEGWKGFKENIEMAHQTLEEAPDFVREDPHYYFVKLRVALGKGVSAREAEELFQAGQKVDPHYLRLYLEMGEFLQPWWHGENAHQWHDWLIKALEQEELSDEDRLAFYGAVVRSKVRIAYEDYPTAEEAFNTMGVDKDRFMKGLAAYANRYPNSAEWPIHYLFHANKAGDINAMKEAVTLAEFKYDPDGWKPNQLCTFFESVVSNHPGMADVLGRKKVSSL